ncbi:hypothetical protein EYV94_22485 [Puteibacter caeruleilacunae]|nr:hypothetical protein EYV94_22485 [Puteibacter caeruleilacunae]
MHINLTNMGQIRGICRIVHSIILLVLLVDFSVVAAENPVDNDHQTQKKEVIKDGKRLFMGLLPFDRKHESCVSCHHVVAIDTFSWYPSALEIANLYHAKADKDLEKVLMEPMGNKMSEVHQEYQFKEEDVKAIKTYLDSLVVDNGVEPKPSVNNLFLFLFLGILITLSLVDLIFTRRIKYRIIPVIVLLACGGYQAKMLMFEAKALGRSKDYAPDQPIKFSHKVHAGENQIDCKYCHNTVDKSRSAGIPSVNLCLNCHSLVREGSNSGQFEINKIHQAVENGQSVEWIRIHKLPDHAYFNHAQHVGVAKLDCNKCHGEVEKMHVLKQESDMSMGWCVNCHRETHVNMGENKYYSSYKEQHEAYARGDKNAFTADELGSNDCMRCHY